MSSSEERYQQGHQLIREVWGEEFGGEILRRLEALSPDLQFQIVEHLYGSLWNRPSPPAPDRKTRSLVTVGILTALHRPNQLRIHIVGALNNGATETEVREVMLQAGLLAGFPTSWDGLVQAEKVFEEYRLGAFRDEARAPEATARSFGG